MEIISEIKTKRGKMKTKKVLHFAPIWLACSLWRRFCQMVEVSGRAFSHNTLQMILGWNTRQERPTTLEGVCLAYPKHYRGTILPPVSLSVRRKKTLVSILKEDYINYKIRLLYSCLIQSEIWISSSKWFLFLFTCTDRGTPYTVKSS